MAQPNYFDQFDDAPLTTGKPTNYFDQFDPTPAEIAAEAEPEPGFGERTMDTLSSAKTSITDELMGSETDMDTSNMDPAMLEAFGAPTTSALERTQGSVADTVGATANVVIDGGLSLIQSILPDSWEDSVIDFSRSAWEAVSQSPIMAEGIEAAKAGMKNYNEWAEKNPEWAKRLSDVVDVSSLGRTAGIKRAGVTPEHIKRGRTAGLKQKKNIRNNRVAQMNEILEPPKGTGEGKYYINQDKWYKPTTYDGSAWEREVARELAKVPDVKYGGTYVDNLNATRTRSLEFRDKLDELVASKGAPVSKEKLLAKLGNKINRMDENLLTGEAREKAIKMYEHLENVVLKDFDGTASGVLKARRELDNWVTGQRKVWDSNFENASGIALRDMRNVLNETVGDAVGTKEVKTLLNRQHKLLTAADKLDAKMVKEADTNFGRLRQKAEEILHTKFPTTPLAVGATAATAATLAGPAGLGTVAGLFGGYKGAKWLASPQGKQWMARIVELADSYPALQPEILALSQISDGLGPKESE